MFWLSLQSLPETFLILRRTERDMIRKCILVFMWSTRYSCQTLMKLEFSRQIFEKTQISNFMKIRLVGAELFHADWQRDTQPVESLFATLLTRLKNYLSCNLNKVSNSNSTGQDVVFGAATTTKKKWNLLSVTSLCVTIPQHSQFLSATTQHNLINGVYVST